MNRPDGPEPIVLSPEAMSAPVWPHVTAHPVTDDIYRAAHYRVTELPRTVLELFDRLGELGYSISKLEDLNLQDPGGIRRTLYRDGVQGAATGQVSEAPDGGLNVQGAIHDDSSSCGEGAATPGDPNVEVTADKSAAKACSAGDSSPRYTARWQRHRETVARHLREQGFDITSDSPDLWEVRDIAQDIDQALALVHEDPDEVDEFADRRGDSSDLIGTFVSDLVQRFLGISERVEQRLDLSIHAGTVTVVINDELDDTPIPYALAGAR